MTGHGHGGGHGAGHGHGHGGGDVPRDAHGNPHDFDAYLSRLEDPERAAWQKPDEVVAALRLAEGAVACDVGAGPGVFTLRLARAVGPRGRVHALDVEPRMLEILARRAADAGLANVHPHAVADGAAPLPPEPCDAVLLVNALHHFPDPAGALRQLARGLAPGGRIAVVDFHGGELPVGPPAEHRLPRERFDAAVREAGLEIAEEPLALPYQYFALLRAAPR